MKSVVILVLMLSSSVALSSELKDVVALEPSAMLDQRVKAEPKAQLNGFNHALHGIHEKSCFAGDSAKVCSEVTASVDQINKELSAGGSGQRFSLVACAQNLNRAMVIYAVKPSRESASQTQNTRKTLFIDRCSVEQGGSAPAEKQLVVFSLSE